MQKYPHIIKSYACILQIILMVFLFPMSFLLSFGICSLQSCQNKLHYCYQQRSYPMSSYGLNSPEFITMIPSFVLGKLFLE